MSHHSLVLWVDVLNVTRRVYRTIDSTDCTNEMPWLSQECDTMYSMSRTKPAAPVVFIEEKPNARDESEGDVGGMSLEDEEAALHAMMNEQNEEWQRCAMLVPSGPRSASRTQSLRKARSASLSDVLVLHSSCGTPVQACGSCGSEVLLVSRVYFGIPVIPMSWSAGLRKFVGISSIRLLNSRNSVRAHCPGLFQGRTFGC